MFTLHRLLRGDDTRWNKLSSYNKLKETFAFGFFCCFFSHCTELAQTVNCVNRSTPRPEESSDWTLRLSRVQLRHTFSQLKHNKNGSREKHFSSLNSPWHIFIPSDSRRPVSDDCGKTDAIRFF